MPINQGHEAAYTLSKNKKLILPISINFILFPQMIAIAAACAFTAAVTAQQPCSFGYGCASMNFTVGHIKGNKWLEGGVGFEEYLMIPYVSRHP